MLPSSRNIDVGDGSVWKTENRLHTNVVSSFRNKKCSPKNKFSTDVHLKRFTTVKDFGLFHHISKRFQARFVNLAVEALA